MDLFRPYLTAISTMEDKQLYLNTGKRQHASIAQVESRGLVLEKSKAVSLKYSERTRYVLAKSVTFDMIITLFDVNSRTLIALRPTLPMEAKDTSAVQKKLERIKNANIEVRAIGLQNGWRGYAKSFSDIYRMSKGHCMEVDMFGEDKRHIMIDLKTGMSYDLLLENRVYRPGELKNDEKEDEFLSDTSPLSFI